MKILVRFADGLETWVDYEPFYADGVAVLPDVIVTARPNEMRNITAVRVGMHKGHARYVEESGAY